MPKPKLLTEAEKADGIFLFRELITKLGVNKDTFKYYIDAFPEDFNFLTKDIRSWKIKLNISQDELLSKYKIFLNQRRINSGIKANQTRKRSI